MTGLANDMPSEIIGREAIDKLKAAGWIVVRNDAIRLAQAMEREQCKFEAKEAA